MDVSLDMPPMTDEEYAALPPLVKPGEDREEVIERVVAGWCDSIVETKYDRHGDSFYKGAFALVRVALTDGNTGQPIDLGELVRRVEERLRAHGEPEEYKQLQDRCILLKGCRVDVFKCSGLKIRPRWITSHVKFGLWASFNSAKFGDRARFDSATFNLWTSFDSASFGVETRFDSAKFEVGASFASAKFGAGARFDSARFGDKARFDSATFGNYARFDSATFGNYARFDSATFGDWARFDSATFGNYARFDSATFGYGARFDSAMFGVNADFLNTRFGSGGGIEKAVPLLSPPPPENEPKWKWWLHRFYRRLCAPRDGFDWVKVQALGRLQILTRVSYLALIIVPILAGVWLAVQAGVQQYRHSLVVAARDFDQSADRLETVLRSTPDKGALPKAEEAAKAIDQLRRRAQEWSATYGPEKVTPRMPIGWALAFLAALGVTLGHLCYQTTCPALIRTKTSDEFRAEQSAAFIACSEGQTRDKLFATFPWFGQLAQIVPRRYHPNFVRRHGQTVWIPGSMEQLDRVEDIPQAPPPETEPAAATSEPADKGSKALPKFSKRELELILIDEGARAQYAVRARENYRMACISGAFYLGAAVLIFWLIVTQVSVVLKAAGWIS